MHGQECARSAATARPKPCPNPITHPVEGGSCNDYDYVCGDPVNGFDLDGRCGVFGNPFKPCGLLRIDSFDAFGPWATDAGTNFEYDATGRLRAAKIKDHALDYDFADSGGCGPQTAAGRNGNRTSVIDNAGTPTTYCYDHADRLVSSSDPAVGTLAYDSHGNTTTLGTQTLIYDGADRHLETKLRPVPWRPITDSEVPLPPLRAVA